MKVIFWALIAAVLLLNIVAIFHAYHFTHFSLTKTGEATANVEDLSFLGKVRVLLFGISNPKPVNGAMPLGATLIYISSEEERLEAWWIPVDEGEPRGNMLLFHGYKSSKSALIDRATAFRKMGYNTLLVDFRGNGGSTGNTCTIGYKEKEDVNAAFRKVSEINDLPICLYGASMGAVSIISSVAKYQQNVDKIIVESPFESMLQTSKNRFENMGLPTFPFAHLLVFWGGVENGFWGFGFRPMDAAKKVNVPVLCVYGALDPVVKRFEVDHIVENWKGVSSLFVIEEGAHANLFSDFQTVWESRVEDFLIGTEELITSDFYRKSKHIW